MESVENVLGHCGRVNKEVLDKFVEPCILFVCGDAQVSYRTAERGALVELQGERRSQSVKETPEVKTSFTLVPARIGTCKNFPLAIRWEGRSGMRLLGGPGAGCHN